MLGRLIVIALVGICAFTAGYSRERFCPTIDNTEYRGAEEREGKLRCVYVVQVVRQMVKSAPAAKHNKQSQEE